MFRALFLGLVAVFVVGCASVPESLQTQSENPITDYRQVVAEPALAQGLEVRMGGIIAAITNQQHRTRIEIVSLPLTKDGRPMLDKKPQGRFVSYVDGFLEPLEYRPGRLLTVAGWVDGSEHGTVGEFNYTFPVIKVSGSQLWQIKQEILLDDFERNFNCIGLRCPVTGYGFGYTRGEVTQRVTK
ncbi:Slp family lipoprotein [uncultured Photobacterium sp.]|uniref:Slp family lipoprotein n=1 Tax=uncultured Photobacterium sp. TaxID=173973 RepID=UPI00260CEDB8|nr:Slp family lipoprotein [uncultured Photobacterium sp.]